MFRITQLFIRDCHSLESLHWHATIRLNNSKQDFLFKSNSDITNETLTEYTNNAVWQVGTTGFISKCTHRRISFIAKKHQNVHTEESRLLPKKTFALTFHLRLIYFQSLEQTFSNWLICQCQLIWFRFEIKIYKQRQYNWIVT